MKPLNVIDQCPKCDSPLILLEPSSRSDRHYSIPVWCTECGFKDKVRVNLVPACRTCEIVAAGKDGVCDGCRGMSMADWLMGAELEGLDVSEARPC